MVGIRLVVFALALTVVFTITSSTHGAEAGGQQIYISQTCERGSVTMTFSWTGADSTAIQQWFDLSLFDNGWQWGTFLGAGPFAPGNMSFQWKGLIPAATHFIRVNQQLPDGSWDPSLTFYFVTVSCGTSVVQSPPPPPPPANNCHPSYTGACLDANASDYDCRGGGGNGPYYTGRVTVVGPDVYRLDGDGDGTGCD